MIMRACPNPRVTSKKSQIATSEPTKNKIEKKNKKNFWRPKKGTKIDKKIFTILNFKNEKYPHYFGKFDET